jgi:membrane protease YdiL (CAAX protease family)
MKIPGFQIPTPILPIFGSTWPAYLLGGIVLILIIPIVEELLFRQLFLKKLLERLSEKNSSIIVAFLFALANLFYLSFTPAFIFGLILNWLFIRTKSVKQCIALHVIKNIIVFTLQLLLIKGVIPLDF